MTCQGISKHTVTELIKGQPITHDKWPADIQIIRPQDDIKNTTTLNREFLSLTLVCRIPTELIYFDGHFDQSPILPGIVQVHWAEAFGRHYFPISGKFTQLEQVKFQQVIKPETEITLQLNYETGKNKLSFSYSSHQGGHSSGRICFS